MRNLKRALSVALAAVMLLGMMVIGAGAMSIDDFADKDEIDNKEAVALMVDLGVLEGLDGPNGTTIFQPDATLQRQAMAKIAYMVATGETDWTLYEKTGNPSFKDIGNSWAKGAIEYCNNLGYITGNGDGTFSPEGKLTVAATATILLRVLGFDNERQGYNGDQWMINAMKDAKNNGLLAGVSNVSGAAFISRQDACQMAYNALFTNVRETNEDRDMGEWYVKGYDVKPYTLGLQSYGLVKLTATADSATTVSTSAVTVTPKRTADTVSTPAATLAGYINAEISKGNYAVTPEMVGGNVTVYAHANYTEASGALTIAIDKLVSSAMVEAPTSVLKTVYGGISSLKDAVDRTSKSYLGVELEVNSTDPTKYAVTCYKNGTSEAVSSDVIASFAAGAQVTASIAKAGAKVEFIDTDNNGKADVVKVTEKTVAVLNNAPTVNKTASATLVTIPELGISNTNVKNVVGYEDLVKGDVVKTVKIGNIFYIEKAEKITGSVAGNHAIYGALINGTYYGATGLSQTVGGATLYTRGSVTNNGTYDFFLDDGGNIAFAIKVTDGTAAVANYAVLADYSWVKPTSTGDMTQNVGSSYMQAKLVFTDGTSQIVRIKNVDGFVPVDKAAQIASVVPAAGSTANNYIQKSTAAALQTEITAIEGGTSKTGTAVGTFTFSESGEGKFYAVYNVASTGTVTSTDRLLGKFFAVNDATSDAGKTDLAGLVTANAFYTYTANTDGSYSLSSAAKAGTGDTLGTLASHVITNGAVKFDGNTVGNNNTVFIYAVQNPVTQAWTYTTYTGINNVPTTAAAPSNTSSNSVVKNAAGVATYVFAVIGSTINESQDIVYIPSASNYTSTTDGSNNVIYSNAIVNGEVKTITTTQAAQDGAGFYTVTSISDKGVYTLNSTKVGAIASSTGSGIGTGVKSTAGNVLITTVSGSNVAYTYPAGCEAYYISANGTSSKRTVETLTIDATDEVYVIAVANNASLVYVVEKGPLPTTLTVTKGSGSGTVHTTEMTTPGGGTEAATKDLLKGNISITGAAADDTYTVATTGSITGMIYKVDISGAGTAVSNTGSVGSTATATYTLVAGDLGATITVTLTATDSYTGNIVAVEQYTIAVAGA